MNLVVSFPQQSHPFTVCLENNSILGRSPINSTILSLISSGFLECSLKGERTTWLTLFDFLFSLPLNPKTQISAFALVQLPSPKKGFPLFLLVLIQVKATVVYLNPHFFTVSNASGSIGKVTQRNKAQLSAAILSMGKLWIS